MRRSIIYFILALSAVSGFSGCQGSNIYGSQSQINTVPTTFENPLGLSTEETSAPPIQKPSTDGSTAAIQNDNLKKQQQKPTYTEPSLFIKKADSVMRFEGKKIGSPCNKYLQRVLEAAGLPKGDFLANDFDLYAKKNFDYYRAVEFKKDNTGSEIDRLQQHIWSYPERTPFIMQWKSKKGCGHIAIVERIADKLVIYQASLNQHSARRDQTTPKILLNDYNRRTLIVYSEFSK